MPIMAANSIKLLTGTSHPELAKLVADRFVFFLRTFGRFYSDSMTRLGIELSAIMTMQNSNHETSVNVGESVRDEDGIPSPSRMPITQL